MHQLPADSATVEVSLSDAKSLSQWWAVVRMERQDGKLEMCFMSIMTTCRSVELTRCMRGHMWERHFTLHCSLHVIYCNSYMRNRKHSCPCIFGLLFDEKPTSESDSKCLIWIGLQITYGCGLDQVCKHWMWLFVILTKKADLSLIHQNIGCWLPVWTQKICESSKLLGDREEKKISHAVATVK